MLSKSQSHYIKAVYELSPNCDDGVRVCDVAEELNVSKASASLAMTNLAKLGLVSKDADKRAHLTTEGERKAIQMLDKFEIIEAFLVEIAACILIGLTNNPPNLPLNVIFELPHIDIKVALMLIPVVACVIFSIALYYPSVRFLVKSNLDDKEIIDKLILLLFGCAYGENDNREKLLSELDLFCNKQKQFVSQYGLAVYIEEYKNHATSISHKPPIELTKHVLDRYAQVKYDIDNYDRAPFPNIGLILSFVFSTVLTVLLSIVTI